jgi:hypothetical protein
VRWCDVTACGSGIGAWCSHSARGLWQLGRLTCETATNRTDPGPDDRGLCLHHFKRIDCRRAAFPEHHSRGGGESKFLAKIASTFGPISADLLVLGSSLLHRSVPSGKESTHAPSAPDQTLAQDPWKMVQTNRPYDSAFTRKANSNTGPKVAPNLVLPCDVGSDCRK